GKKSSEKSGSQEKSQGRAQESEEGEKGGQEIRQAWQETLANFRRIQAAGAGKRRRGAGARHSSLNALSEEMMEERPGNCFPGLFILE
ncbi:MAG: hypothetical protein LAO19_18475, partial [Acidobacteriia bacterium]|nr:hypothetical protein [Terriglobia bacterium]